MRHVAAGAALNVWNADPTLVTERATGADALEVTWAGPPPESAPAAAETVALMAGAGATWVVFGWPVDVDGARRGRARRVAWPIVGGGRPAAVDFDRWSFVASTGCRPTSSPRSTISRRTRGEPDAT